MEVKRPENEPIAAYREKNGSKPRGNLQGFFSRRALVFSPSAIASKTKEGNTHSAVRLVKRRQRGEDGGTLGEAELRFSCICSKSERTLVLRKKSATSISGQTTGDEVTRF